MPNPFQGGVQYRFTRCVIVVVVESVTLKTLLKTISNAVPLVARFWRSVKACPRLSSYSVFGVASTR